MSLSDFINRDLGKPSTHDMNVRGLLQNAIQQTTINKEIDEGGTSTYHGNVEDDLDTLDLNNLINPAAHSGPKAEGAPGYLMQADILQQIGSFITARSDTFTIRAYGEAVNPVTGEVESKSMCEAVVQRVNEPIAPGSMNELEPDLSKNDLGRRFIITGFRWVQ